MPNTIIIPGWSVAVRQIDVLKLSRQTEIVPFSKVWVPLVNPGVDNRPDNVFTERAEGCLSRIALYHRH